MTNSKSWGDHWIKKGGGKKGILNVGRRGRGGRDCEDTGFEGLKRGGSGRCLGKARRKLKTNLGAPGRGHRAPGGLRHLITGGSEFGLEGKELGGRTVNRGARKKKKKNKTKRIYYNPGLQGRESKG